MFLCIIINKFGITINIEISRIINKKLFFFDFIDFCIDLIFFIFIHLFNLIIYIQYSRKIYKRIRTVFLHHDLEKFGKFL